MRHKQHRVHKTQKYILLKAIERRIQFNFVNESMSSSWNEHTARTKENQNPFIILFIILPFNIEPMSLNMYNIGIYQQLQDKDFPVIPNADNKPNVRDKQVKIQQQQEMAYVLRIV